MAAILWLSGGIGLKIMLQLVEHKWNFISATTSCLEDNVKLLALEGNIDNPISSKLTMTELGD